MAVYTSRYSNPELRKGTYITVRISLGTPRWDVGYRISGELKYLMPFGLLDKYENFEDFKREYFPRLDGVGVSRIRAKLDEFKWLGQDVVLLCYEDIRKGPENWCHRVAFAEWWKMRTGETINELPDPTPVRKTAATSPSKKGIDIPSFVQLSLF